MDACRDFTECVSATRSSIVLKCVRVCVDALSGLPLVKDRKQPGVYTVIPYYTNNPYQSLLAAQNPHTMQEFSHLELMKSILIHSSHPTLALS